MSTVLYWLRNLLLFSSIVTINVCTAQTIIDIASEIDDFSILLAALDKADLTSTLQGDGPFTVFAPTNEAFRNLAKKWDAEESELLDIPDLDSILLYHVVAAFVKTDDLMDATLTTVNGQNISIFFDSEKENFQVLDTQNTQKFLEELETANIVLENIEASNGVIHVIDAVLLPLFDSVFSICSNIPSLSILETALETVGLDDNLKDPSEQFALFAPSNDAFMFLIETLMIDVDDLLNVPSLAQILLYHVTPTAWFYEDFDLLVNDPDLYGGPSFPTLNEQNLTMIEQDQEFALFDAQRHISPISSLINIATKDGRNGVVHVVDRVVIPLFEDIAQIATSFDDYSILVDLLIETQLVDVLQNDGPFTVFAPNNNAFERLMDDLGLTFEELKNFPSDVLEGLLLYHVVGGIYTADDPELENGDLETVMGQFLVPKINNLDMDPVDGFAVDGFRVKDNQQRKVDVIIADLQAKNGVVHVVDQVLVPIFESVAQIVASFDTLSILEELLIAADLVDTLNEQSNGPFTVFAPTNDAFNQLLDALGVTLDDLKNLATLRDILLYHVIEGNKLTTDFRERNYETLNGQTIRWDEQGNGCPDGVGSGDGNSGSGSDSDSNSKDEDESGGCTDGFEVDGYRVIDAFGDANEVLTGNVQAVNGVVHTIDGVLLPQDWQPSS